MVICEELIAVDVVAADADATMELLGEMLCRSGATEPRYTAAVIAREAEHPTGLPTKPFPIAIPHAGTDGVLRSAIAVACLRSPVGFRNMGDPDEELMVEMVLMLATASAEEQVPLLRDLTLVFGDPERLGDLRSQPSSRAVAEWMRKELSIA